MRLRWQAVPLLFVLVSLPLAMLPRRIAFWFSATTGTLFYYLLPTLRTIAVRNIANTMTFFSEHPDWQACHGTPEQIARRSFGNLGRSVGEMVKIYYGLGQRIIDRVEFRGIEHYRRAREAGKGVILLTGHCGNWEVLGLSVGIRLGELHVVARIQPTQFITSLLERLRRRFGNHIIYRDGAVRRIMTVLRRKGTVGVLIDQAVQENEGLVVDFLGRGAWTTTVPALLAQKTGVPLLPVFIHREGGHHVVEFQPVVMNDATDVAATTRHLSEAIENHIVRHPDEWLWVYRRWKRAAEWAPSRAILPIAPDKE